MSSSLTQSKRCLMASLRWLALSIVFRYNRKNHSRKLLFVKKTLFIHDSSLNYRVPAIQALGTVLGPSRYANLDEDNPTLEGIARLVICAIPQAGLQALEWISNHSRDIYHIRSISLVEIAQEDEKDTWLLARDAWQEEMEIAQLSARIAPDDIENAVDFALALRKDDHLPTPGINPMDMLDSIENFLNAHNTCTLSTTFHGKAHATPIEYHYQRGKLFLISEGGEKFAGLLTNERVCVAIYDPFMDFSTLGGLQCSGKVKLPLPGTNEYMEAAGICSLSTENIASLPFVMNIIIINLQEAIFTWSGFSKMGLDIHQVFRFEE